MRTIGTLFTKLVSSAKARGIPVLINQEQLWSIIKDRTCHYCSAVLDLNSPSVDRKSSKEGYTIDNLVPCCGECNKEKGSMEYEEYMLVVNNRKQNPPVYEPHPRLKEFSDCLGLDLMQHPDGYFVIGDPQGTRIYISGFANVKRIATKTTLTFFDSEITRKPLACLSILKTRAGLCERIAARKTEIRKVPTQEHKEFLHLYHLRGYSPAPAFGLYYNDSLVMLLSYKSVSPSKANGDTNTFELVRVCAKGGIVVVGGLSKLLSRMIAETGAKKVMSFVDRRFHTGSGLTAVGFYYAGTSESWYWCDGKDVYNRLRCTANMDHRGLSEKEHAMELGLYKLYDGGQDKFEYVVPEQKQTKLLFSNADTESWEDLKERLNKHGLSIINSWKDYSNLNRHRVLSLQCQNSHVFSRSRHRLKTITNCPECTGKSNKLSYMDKMAAMGWHSVVGAYDGKFSELSAQCEQGHEFSMQYVWFRDNRCPKCAHRTHSRKTLGGTSEERRRGVFELVLGRCQETGQKCHTSWEEFRSSDKPSARVDLSIECSNGHHRRTTWQVFKDHGCGQCNRVPQTALPEKKKAKTTDKRLASVAIGEKFGYLSVHSTNGAVIICKCDCGELITVLQHRLTSGHTVSCGCKQFSKEKKPVIKGGLNAEQLEYVDNCGYDYIKGAVLNDASTIEVKCRGCDNIKTMSYRSLKDNCLLCYTKALTKKSFDNAVEMIEGKGFRMITTFDSFFAECQNKDKRNALIGLVFECVKGHKQKVTMAKVKTKKRWVCAECLIT